MHCHRTRPRSELSKLQPAVWGLDWNIRQQSHPDEPTIALPMGMVLWHPKLPWITEVEHGHSGRFQRSSKYHLVALAKGQLLRLHGPKLG